MDLKYYGNLYGKRFFRVVRDGRTIFTGLKGECERYMRLHVEKQEKESRELVAPRRRKLVAKRYRVATRRARTF